MLINYRDVDDTRASTHASNEEYTHTSTPTSSNVLLPQSENVIRLITTIVRMS